MAWHEPLDMCAASQGSGLPSRQMVLPRRMRRICVQESTFDEQHVGIGHQSLDPCGFAG